MFVPEIEVRHANKEFSDTRGRTKILEEMVSRKIFKYEKVAEITKEFQKKGVSGLPFPV